MNNKKIYKITALTAAIIMLISGCFNAAKNPPVQNMEMPPKILPSESTLIDRESTKINQPNDLPPNTVRVGISEISGIYDPWFSSTVYDIYPQNLMFDYLIGFDENGLPVPELADYTISDDGLTYTFTLKDDLTYSDNTPIEAQDFVFALSVYADPAYDGFYDFSMLGIAGYDAYQNGDATSISGLEAPNKNTLIVHLEKPSLSAIYSLSLPAVSRRYYGEGYQKGDLSALKEKVKKPLGSGQYVLDRLVPNQSLTLTSNPLHYRGEPKIEKCVFSVTPPDMELERAILQETDIECSHAEPDILKRAENAAHLQKHLFPYSGFGYIGLNNQNIVFADKLTRQALACAIDRKGVTKLIYGNNAEVINAPVSKISWAYDPSELDSYSFDLTRAGQLLSQAGWSKNTMGILEKDGVLFEFTFTVTPDNPVCDALSLVMQDSLSKLGIRVTIQTVDFNTMYDKIFEGTIDMWFGALGFVPDPSVQPLYHSEGYQNFGYYTNPETDALIEEIDEAKDMNTAKLRYAALWKHLNEEMPAIFLYQRNDFWVTHTRISGLKIDSYNDFFRSLYKAEIKSQ